MLRLFHILKSVLKNNHTVGWMMEMDGARLSAWLQCLTASKELKNDLGPEGRGNLSELLELPAFYGGDGLQPLVTSVDEEFLGSFAGIAASLISFCKNTKLQVYIKIAEALEQMEDLDVDMGCTSMDGVKEAYERTGELREPLSEVESRSATELVIGSRLVEVPGAYDPEISDSAIENVTLPESRHLNDYPTAPCKHECGIIKQIRHAKQAHRLVSTLNPIKQSRIRATA